MSSLLLIAAIGVTAYLFLTTKSEDAGLFSPGDPRRKEGAGANVPSPSSDATRTPFTLPDGRVISTHPAVALAMLQAVQTGDPAYIRTTAEQLRVNGWPVEADALLDIARQVENKGSSAPSQPQAVPPVLPSELLSQVMAAVTSQDVAKMQEVSRVLRERGYTQAADSVDQAIAVVLATKQPLPAISTSQLPSPTAPQPLPTASTPQLPSPSVALPTSPTTPQQTPRRAAADALVRHLTVDAPAKRKENQSIVRAYQTAAGRVADGLYGPGDARSLADPQSGSHVPPPPRYWPKKGYQAALRDYEAWLVMQRETDPSRSAEWSAALATARRYYPS